MVCLHKTKEAVEKEINFSLFIPSPLMIQEEMVLKNLNLKFTKMKSIKLIFTTATILLISFAFVNAQINENTLTTEQGLKFIKNLGSASQNGGILNYYDTLINANNDTLVPHFKIRASLDTVNANGDTLRNNVFIKNTGEVVIGADQYGNIGTTNPCGMLRVNGNSIVNGKLEVKGEDGIQIIKKLGGDNQSGCIINYNDTLINSSNDTLAPHIKLRATLDTVNGNGDTLRNNVIIKNTGEVVIGADQYGNIGTTNPCGMLRVNGNSIVKGKLEVADSTFTNFLGSDVICAKFVKGDTIQFKVRIEAEKEAIRLDGSTMWDIPSDKKLKTNIQSLEQGLEELLKINLYNYEYKKTGKKRMGIMAQEMQKLLPSTIGSFRQDGQDYLSFNPSDLFYVHIKATQELAGKVNELEDELEDKTDRINELENKVDELSQQYETLIQLLSNKGDNTQLNNNTTINDSKASLSNSPNPTSDWTSIQYFIPANIQSAQLLITNQQGQTLLQQIILERGQGQIDLDLRNFDDQSTMFHYTLILDGKKSESQKMLFIK